MSSTRAKKRRAAHTRRRQAKPAHTVAGIPGTLEETLPEPVRVAADPNIAALYAANGARSYEEFHLGECLVCVTWLPDGKWLMTIAHGARYPSWDEVKYARYRLLPPAVSMAMLLPPPEQYVNGERFMFHLFEVAADTTNGTTHDE